MDKQDRHTTMCTKKHVDKMKELEKCHLTDKFSYIEISRQKKTQQGLVDFR